MRIRAASPDPPAPGSLPSDLRARAPREVRRAVAAELERMERAEDVRVLLAVESGSRAWGFASPIVYAEDPAFAVVRELAAECFSPVASAHHYLSMGRNHLAALAGETVRLKKCLYTMRAILAARWVVAERASAPMLLRDLVDVEPPASVPWERLDEAFLALVGPAAWRGRTGV